MITDPENLTPQNADPAEPAPAPPTPFAYRGNGKIARLPKAQRDQLNQWLLDGLSYPDIIQRLGEQGKNLTPDNVSEWKKRGYQDWLLEQAWLDRIRFRQESASNVSAGYDATQVNHAALQLGTLHIFEAFRELGPESLNKKLGGDCAAFARLINALARASRETMQLQKYRDACDKARLAMEPMKDPHRKLTDSETRAIVAKVDEILGIKPLQVLAQEYNARLKAEAAGRNTASFTEANHGTEAKPEDGTRKTEYVGRKAESFTEDRKGNEVNDSQHSTLNPQPSTLNSQLSTTWQLSTSPDSPGPGNTSRRLWGLLPAPTFENGPDIPTRVQPLPRLHGTSPLDLARPRVCISHRRLTRELSTPCPP